MRPQAIAAVVLAVLLLCLAPAWAGPPQKAAVNHEPVITGIRVLEVGVFASRVDNRERAATVADGIRDRARDFVLLARGTTVEARLDTGIGLRYQLIGQPMGAPVTVDVVVRHPQMTNPETGLPMTHSAAGYERAIGRVEHSVWSFDRPGDLLPGQYVIEILYKGEVLTRQEFRVSLPR